MKKIIKHGISYKRKRSYYHTYYFICKTCTCEFEMTNIDLIKEQVDLLFMPWSNCPECNSRVRGCKLNE